MELQTNSGIDASLLEQYLRATFSKPPAGFLSSIFGGEKEYSYEICSIDPYRFMVPGVALAWVEVEGRYLDYVPLPGARSRGLFAEADSRIWYVKSETAVAEVLNAATAALAAAELAVLVSDACLSQKNTRHRVLHSFSDLEEMTHRRVTGGTYILRQELLAVLGKQITAPTDIPCAEGQRQVQWCTLGGWMHEAQDIYQTVATISSDGSLRYQSSKIESRIFSAIPRILY